MISVRATKGLDSDLTRFFAPFVDIPKESNLNAAVYDLSVGNIKQVPQLLQAFQEIKPGVLQESLRFSRSYPGTQGLLELNSRLAELIKKETGKSVQPNEIVLTNGAVEAISTSLFVYSNSSDKTYYAVPSFPYWAMCSRAEVQADYFFIEKSDQYAQEFGTEFAKAIQKDKRIKTVIIDQPHGPFGANVNKDQLEIVNEECKRKGIKIIFDDVYRTLNNGSWCGKYIDIQDAVLVDSLSKRCAMPGFRLGFVRVPESEIKFFRAAVANECVGINNAVCVLATKILDFYEEHRLFAVISDEIKKRQRELEKAVQGLKKFGISSPEPQGSMYRILEVGAFREQTGIGAEELTKKLREAGVKLIPNNHFYPPDVSAKKQVEFLRVSVGGDPRIKEAIEKVTETLETLV